MIGRLKEAIGATLKILAGPNSPTTVEPRAIGVARVSIGGSLARACLTFIQATVDELCSTGSYGFAKDSFSNAALNRRVTR